MAVRSPLDVADIIGILEGELAHRRVVTAPLLAQRIDEHLKQNAPGRRGSRKFAEKQLDQGKPLRALTQAAETRVAAAVPLPRQTGAWAGPILSSTNYVLPPTPSPNAANEPELLHHLDLGPRQRQVATSFQMALDGLGHDATTVRLDPAEKHGFGDKFDIHFFQRSDADCPLTLASAERAVLDLYAPARMTTRRTLADVWEPITIRRVAPTASFSSMTNPYIGGHPAMPPADDVSLEPDEWEELTTPQGAAPIQVIIRKPRTRSWRRELTSRNSQIVQPIAKDADTTAAKTEGSRAEETHRLQNVAAGKFGWGLASGAWTEIVRRYLVRFAEIKQEETGPHEDIDVILCGPGSGKTQTFVSYLTVATAKHTRGIDFTRELERATQTLPSTDEEIPYDALLDLMDRWELVEIPAVARKLESGPIRLKATMRLLTVVSLAELNEIARARAEFDAFNWQILPKELSWMQKTIRDVRHAISEPSSPR